MGLCGSMFSVLVGVLLRVELLGLMVTPNLVFLETAKLCFKAAAPSYVASSK